MPAAAFLLLATLAHLTPALLLRDDHSCEDHRCYSVHLSARPLTLREAWGHCHRMTHGRGYLATVHSPAEARQLGSLLDSVAPDSPTELWLGLRRDRRACEELPGVGGPLRGFAWTMGGAEGGAGAGDGTYAAWRQNEPALSCSLAHCATLSRAGKEEARAAVVEWRPRYCANATGVRGVACRWAQEGNGGERQRAGARGEREGEQGEGGWVEGARREGERRRRDAKTCQPGYAFNAVSNECEDVDECDDMHVCENALCDNKEGSFTCDCLPGYSKVNDTACEDVDECQEDHLCNQWECINRSGFYECSCPAGYKQHANGLNCIDVDECSGWNRGGCMHACVNSEGSYTCECESGYELGRDGKSCSENPAVVVTSLEATTTTMAATTTTMMLTSNEMALFANAQPSPGALSKGLATGPLLWLLLGTASLAVCTMAGVLLYRRYCRGSRRQNKAAEGGAGVTDGSASVTDGSVRGQGLGPESRPLAAMEVSL
ncbi:uncharacterized protein LOC116950479 [Petromyzon marinus]|uniref:uncharacterized protein LOC116950479 n=1 Tax=Petromyzon marinus TaxID=7757 RepID=UPI003F71A90C